MSIVHMQGKPESQWFSVPLTFEHFRDARTDDLEFASLPKRCIIEGFVWEKKENFGGAGVVHPKVIIRNSGGPAIVSQVDLNDDEGIMQEPDDLAVDFDNDRVLSFAPSLQGGVGAGTWASMDRGSGVMHFKVSSMPTPMFE